MKNQQDILRRIDENKFYSEYEQFTQEVHNRTHATWETYVRKRGGKDVKGLITKALKTPKNIKHMRDL